MLKLYLWIRNLLAGEEGQTLVEYALIIVLVAVLISAALILFRGSIEGVFTRIAAALATT